MILIDHDKYGERTEFENISDAFDAIKACGIEHVELHINFDGEIIDQDGDIVGEEITQGSKKPSITIEKHTPIDGDYYLIDVDGDLFAKVWRYEDALRIKEALSGKENNNA